MFATVVSSTEVIDTRLSLGAVFVCDSIVDAVNVVCAGLGSRYRESQSVRDMYIRRVL